MRRRHSIVRRNGSGRGRNRSSLNTLNDAIYALVSLLLRRAVLLVFLEIGATTHVRTKAGSASSSWRIVFGHRLRQMLYAFLRIIGVG
jgi:hypothetical protein